MKKIIRLTVIVVISAAAIGLWLHFSGDRRGKPQPITVTVQKADFVSKVQATGTLEPQELVDVGAQVTGEIKEFGQDSEGRRIDYGSEVKAGQLLARIDDTLVELEIKRAEASVAQAEAQIISADAAVKQAEASIARALADKNKADRDMARAKKLGVGEALSQMEYDQYVTSAESSEAALRSAEAQLHTANAQRADAKAGLQSAQAQLQREVRNRDYTRITTPVDGTVIVRRVNVGQTVVSNMNATTLFLVARDLSRMQIWASVNEADIAKVHPGQEVRYTVDALPNETFTGTVNKIRPNATMTSNVVTYIAEVDITNPERRLLPYMSADTNFIVEEIKDCLIVPDTVFRFTPPKDLIAPGTTPAISDEDTTIVWKKVGDRVQPIPVKRRTGDGTRSVIIPVDGTTLDAGDEVVIALRQIDGSHGVAADEKKGTNLFGMNRPQRRPRSSGGVEAKTGQPPKDDRPGPPPV